MILKWQMSKLVLATYRIGEGAGTTTTDELLHWPNLDPLNL